MSYQYSYGPPGQRPPQYGGAPQGGYGAPPPQQQQQYSSYGGAPPQQHSAPYGSSTTHGPAYGGSGGYQPSSYGGSRPQAYTSHSGPPPGTDPQLWQWFVSVDRDGSGHINPLELQQALVNGDWTPFELDTIKLLMNMFDTDRSGSITYNEFVGLWKYVQDWQGVFKHFDADRSGAIDTAELARALSSFGYNLNPRLLNVVVRKFAANARGITFDRFVRCCVVIKTLTESFSRRDVQRTGQITLTYDDFMEMCLSAP